MNQASASVSLLVLDAIASLPLHPSGTACSTLTKGRGIDPLSKNRIFTLNLMGRYFEYLAKGKEILFLSRINIVWWINFVPLTDVKESFIFT